MTTFEHALFGGHVGLALGLHRRSPALPVIAAMASVLPDWDGLTILSGGTLYDRVHRVWGHSVLTAVPLGLLLAWIDGRLRSSSKIARLTLDAARPSAAPHVVAPPASSWAMLTAAFFAAAHLAEDMIVSGGMGLSHWPVQWLWPLSDQGLVYPMLRWGDPSPTLILCGGLIAAAKWPDRAAACARFCLLVLAVYAVGSRAVRVGGIG